MTIAMRVRPALAVAVLAALAVAWAALPAGGAAAGEKPVLIAAVACALFTIARLLIGSSGAPQREVNYVNPVADSASGAWSSLRMLPWPQGVTVAALGLEALHPSGLGIPLCSASSCSASCCRCTSRRHPPDRLCSGRSLRCWRPGSAWRPCRRAQAMLPAIGAGSDRACWP
jgi:hypothetical protein